MNETEKEIRQTVGEGGEQGGESSGSEGEGDGAPDGGNGDSALSALPVPSLSKRQMVLIGVAVVALVVVYQMRSGSGGASATSRQDAREAIDDIDATEEITDDESGDAIELPADPDEVLDLDDAVLEAIFREDD